MTNRVPSKSIEGRRVRLLHCPNVEDGSTGQVVAVNTESGDVAVTLDAGTNVVINWANGDRWMVIPQQAPAYPAVA